MLIFCRYLFAVVVTFLYLNSNLKKSNKKIEKDSGNTEIKTEEQNKDSNLEIEQVGNQSDSDKENTTSNSYQKLEGICLKKML